MSPCLRCRTDMDLVVAIERSSSSHTRSHANVWRCRPCGDGELREYSFDCWPSEDEWHMTWTLRLAGADLDTLAGALPACPDPAVPTCECAVHVRLRATQNAVHGARIDRPGRVDPENLPVVRVALTDGLPELVR